MTSGRLPSAGWMGSFLRATRQAAEPMATDPSQSTNRGEEIPTVGPISAGYRITIDPTEAAVVCQIFHMFREGLGEKAIAKRLNLQSRHHVGSVLLQSPGMAKASRDRATRLPVATARPVGVLRDRHAAAR